MNRLRHSLIAAGIGLLLGAFSAEARQVGSVSDFVLHMKAHIQRLNVLGEAVLDHFPEEFPGVDRHLALDFLRLHDRSKTNAKSGFAKRLFEFYGKNPRDLSPEQKARLSTLVDELNAYDHNVQLKFFRKNGLIAPSGELRPEAKSLLRLEKIVDWVDRGEAKVSREEFNKVMKPASEMLQGTDNTMARYLEDHYPDLTESYSYHPIRDCKHRALESLLSR